MNAMQQVQVLVADDDSSLLDLMAGRLDKLGYEVDRAETGRAASVLLNRKDYDLIVSDIYMPEVTGLALLKQAKEKDPHIQVVVVTASATLETAIEAMNAGAFAYLTKPFDHLSVFDNIVSRAVEFRRLVLDNIRMAESQKRRGDMLEEELTERFHLTRKRQRELIEILACLPDGVVVVEEGGRVVLSSPVAEKWLARELRMGEQPIQRFLETVHDEWADTQIDVAIGKQKLKILAIDLPVEGEKARKVVVLRSTDLNQAEIGNKLLEPVQDLKRGLSRLYKTATDTKQSALLRKMATDVAQLEELQESLNSSNGHLAPAVLPPSWREEASREGEDIPSPSFEIAEEAQSTSEQEVVDGEAQSAGQVMPADDEILVPAEQESVIEDKVETPVAEVDPAPVEGVLPEEIVEGPLSGDLMSGSAVILADGEGEAEPPAQISVDAPAEVQETPEAVPVEVKGRTKLDVPTVSAEERKALWKKVKERGWTTRLDKETASERSEHASKAQPKKEQGSKGVSMDAPTIPADVRSLAKAVGKAAKEPSPASDKKGDEVKKKGMDDEEALEAFSVSLLEFEPKTRIHKPSKGKKEMSWPPPPPSKYNPEDYKEPRS